MISICGVVVHARLEAAKAVRSQLDAFEGVEVHAEAPGGRFVVTIDTSDENDTIALLDHMQELDGVVSTALTYGHYEY